MVDADRSRQHADADGNSAHDNPTAGRRGGDTDRRPNAQAGTEDPFAGTGALALSDLNAATIADGDGAGIDLNAATVNGAPSPVPPPPGDIDLTARTLSVVDDDLRSHWAATITEDLTAGMTIKGEREGARGEAASAAPNRETRITVNTRILRDLSQHRTQVTRRRVRGDEAGNDLAGKVDYELVKLLGEGGMGMVYQARQTSIDRSIAIKMIKSKAARNEAARGKFLSEAAVTGDLDHPNIVPIHDLGDNGRGQLFYAMKHVRGVPWDEVIKTKTLTENLEILEDVCNAIAFAHDRGIIHRDIKPENVMLGGYGEVLVMDWGLAAAVSAAGKAARLAPKTGVCGTPAYMAPEMALGRGDMIGPASDVYLLGAILFEIITGDPPHTGATVIKCLESAVMNVIRETEEKGELLDIAMRAMHTDLARRYATVKEFQAAIGEYKSHFESISLAKRAQDELAQAAKSREYEDFSKAVFGFHEALNLWRRNRDAEEGLSRARLAYARCAMDKGDLDLAESQLVEMTEEFRVLRNQVVNLRVERERRQKILTFAKYAVAALLCIVIAGGSILGYLINEESKNAKRQKRLADAKRVEAEQEKEKARLSAIKARQEKEKAKAAATAATRAEERAKKDADAARRALRAARQAELLRRQGQAREGKLKELRWVCSSPEEARARQRDAARKHHLPVKLVVSLPGGKESLVLRLIPAGRFTMGSRPEEAKREATESLHDVQISRPFYMAELELTRGQWRALMGRPAPLPEGLRPRDVTSRFPVADISYTAIVTRVLPALQQHAPAGFRFDLPTEAEWEYAARAGSGTAYCFGDDPGELNKYAWFSANSHNQVQATGRKLPNAWGLRDVFGNVAEWCKDAFDNDYYLTVADQALQAVTAEAEARGRKHPAASKQEINAMLETPPLAVDPCNRRTGPNVHHVVRGGSYLFIPELLRAAHRSDAHALSTYPYLGLRVVLRPASAPARPAPSPAR